MTKSVQTFQAFHFVTSGYRNLLEILRLKSSLVAYGSLFIFIVFNVLTFHFIKVKSGFWGIDASLFLRYANDPEFYHYTSPAIAKAIEGNPAFTREIVLFLNSIGLTYKDNYLWTYLGSITIATTCVYLAGFHILRSMGLGLLASALFTILVLNSWFIIDYSRLHPLKNVMKDGGFSMLANSIFLLAISMHVYRKTIVGAVLIFIAALLHPVIGILGSGYILGSLLIYMLIEERRLRFTPQLIAAFLAIAGILTMYVLRKDISVLLAPGVFDREVFFQYVYFRSSNPMPLRDGLHVTITHLFIFTSVLFLAKVLWRDQRYMAVLVISISVFWVAGWFAQIVFGEVLQSATLVRLVLHRTTPLMFLIAGCLLVALMYQNIQRKRYTSFILFVSAFAIYMLSGANLLDFVIFENRQMNIVFWLGLISVFALYEQGNSGKSAYLRVYVLCLGLLFASLYFGSGLKVRNIFNEGGFFPVLLLVLAAWVGSYLLRDHSRVKTEDEQKQIIYASSALLVIFLAGANFAHHFGVALTLARNSTQLYSRYDLIESIQKNTPRDAVIYTTSSTDLNGIRKTFFDWKHSWYNLYSLGETAKIADRMKVLGIDIRNDERANKYCGDGKWLFRSRCHRIYGNVDDRLKKFDWRSNWDVLKKHEPRLSYVIVHRRKLKDSDMVVGGNRHFAIVKP